MSNPAQIRILETDNNRRGDLFGRLMADLFIALGYEQPRLNIHKSGRELDLSANHRLESRRAIAECKATSETIGGDDLNKFVDALDVEHDENRPISGYFISLSGFKETAIEQETQRRRTKVITLTGPQVVNELVNGRILIRKDRATELAGRCCTEQDNLVLDADSELLAHERGWIWVIYYTSGKARTHFVLVHSDGTLLARVLAEEIMAADRDCGGQLEALTCLNPQPTRHTDDDPHLSQAMAAYRQYIANECGYIQLDGLPADSDVGARRLNLENLFVPLSLDLDEKDSLQAPRRVDPGEEEFDKEISRLPVGVVLQHYPRLALLASPGGGKSTLLKRLAVAYADPVRRERVADNLPARDWVPIFIRCRELGRLARASFAELLEALSLREPVRQYAPVFRAFVDGALLRGQVMLLVDGLDEISDPGDRAVFVCTLRAVLQAYPAIAIVVTSREAGFRHVAAHLAPVCTQARLSPFDDGDIRRLTVAWHLEVVGDTEKVRADANELATTIVRNDRISQLAVNPLLLTTLLLVKRWVGSLPTRRAVLYGKAVEVLLMTWNTEGHKPIPEEEALPQLCYVASAMMFSKVQKISRPRLAELLQEAREALPTELSYVQDTVAQFIHRIEDRSSLLTMTGHDVEDGQLVEFFEFRHLTFQEFLTARAMVEGWHQARNEKDTLVTVLSPHFQEEDWREVVPLAAVLGGQETEALIQKLAERVREEIKDEWEAKGNPMFLALLNCLVDEAAARPETIRSALREVVRVWQSAENSRFGRPLARGRYGTDLRDEARKAFLGPRTYLGHAAWALMHTVWWQTAETENVAGFERVATQFLKLLKSSETTARCEGALGFERLSYVLCKKTRSDYLQACARAMCEAGPALTLMLFSEQKAEQYAAAWALVWLGACQIPTPQTEADVLGRLFKLWRHGPQHEIRSIAGWALGSQPLLPRATRDWSAAFPRSELKTLFQGYDSLKERTGKPVAIIVAWYVREPWSDLEIAERASTLLNARPKNDPISQTLREILKQIDKPAAT
jgi:hypothetical protein